MRLGGLAPAPGTPRREPQAPGPRTPRISGTAAGGLDLSAVAARRADTVAGFLCAFSFALSGIAIARDPGLLAPVAIVVALVAARMTVAHRTLAAVAVAVATLAFFLGMVVAIATDNPLF